MTERKDYTVTIGNTEYRIHYQWDCGLWNADDGTDTGWISLWCQTAEEAEDAARDHARTA